MRRFVCGIAVSVIAITSFFASPAALSWQSPQDLTVNADPADNTPHVLDGDVFAIAVAGNTVVLGGAFTQARNAAEGSPVVPRSNLLAFDRTTGAILPAFHPALDGDVRTLAPGPDGTSVYVGGKFNVVDGQPRSKLVRVNVTTGVAVPGFAPGLINSSVFDVELAGGRLLVGGYFTSINGTPRGGLAELDPATGAVRPGVALAAGGTAWGGFTGVTKLDTTPDGSRLVMTGNFRTVGGQSRVQIAMVDLTTTPAALTSWSTGAYDIKCGRSEQVQFDLRDVDFSPDGSYFVTVATGALAPPGALCDTAARWETARSGAGQQPTWVAETGNDSVYSVALTGSTVYVGGHFRWFNNPHAKDTEGPGAVSREGIAALDPANGLPLTWNPGRIRGRAVWDMVATPDALYVGSDTDRIGGFEYHARIAMFPLADGTPVPQPPLPDLAVDTYLVSPRTDPGELVVKRPDFDGTTAGAAESLPGLLPADTRAAVMVAGHLYTAHENGTLVRRTISGDVFTDPVVVDLHGLTAFAGELARMTSMFTADGRLYYTLADEKALFVRGFSVQSDVVGATRDKVPSVGLKLTKVRGGFLTSAGLYLCQRGSGDLYHIEWAAGAPMSGSRTLVSGPTTDGIDWSSLALTARDSV